MSDKISGCDGPPLDVAFRMSETAAVCIAWFACRPDTPRRGCRRWLSQGVFRRHCLSSCRFALTSAAGWKPHRRA